MPAAPTIESSFTAMFDQAVQTFGDAVKAGVRIQEDMTRWWSDALERTGPLGEWQKRTLSTVQQAIPVAQQNTEEWLKIFENGYHQSVELMKKAMEARDAGEAPAEYQARMQQIWESAMQMMRQSAQTAAHAQLKMLTLMGELLKQNFNGAH